MLILIIFALGGSLTGLVGRKLMSILEIEILALYLIIYILLVTAIWPFLILLVSVPFGQFSFFRRYIAKMGSKLFSKKKN